MWVPPSPPLQLEGVILGTCKLADKQGQLPLAAAPQCPLALRSPCALPSLQLPRESSPWASPSIRAASQLPGAAAGMTGGKNTQQIALLHILKQPLI